MSETAPSLPVVERRRRFVEKPRRARHGETCDLCAQPVPEEHTHLVQVDTRRLLCACRPCSLFFEPELAAARYRVVPDRYLDLGGGVVSDAQWERLRVPGTVAFFYVRSSLGRVAAFYPGVAGTAESLLPLGTWEEIVAGCPELAGLVPDVEALLIRRRGQRRFESFLVPIDVCYELADRIYFGRGDEARRGIDEFFERLHDRAAELCPR